MSLDGNTFTFVPYTLNGINPTASATDISNCVKYTGNTSNTNLNGFDLETTGTLAAQFLALPADNTKTENFIMYSISTNGNLSTTGGLITTDLTNGRSMYFTGGVVGAPNFQFTTLGTDNKVVVTDGNRVMSTTINAGQLDYITALTSQAGGVGQANTWTDANTFTSTTSVGALRITSSVANVDYSVSVNGTDFLEFTNLLSLQKVFTDGDSFWVPNRIFCNSTIYTSDLQMGNAIYFAYGTGQQWGTILNGGGEYVIQDDVGDTRLKLSKTTGLTVSTLNVVAIPSATPTLALGVDGSGGIVSYAVPSPPVNLLPLNNVWTGTNTFENTVSTLATTTVSSKAYTTAILQTAGISSQAISPGVISGTYLLTPSPTTSPFASCYSPTQNFITGARYAFRFNGFSYGVFGMSLTMFQANVGNTSSVAISASFPFTLGTFTGVFTPNINPSFLGQVYLQFQGTANKTFSWTSFTYEVGTLEVVGELEMNGIANINGGTNFAVANNYMSPGSLTIGDPARNYGGGAGWTTNTAGLLFECLDNTEIAVHDAGLRVASMMYYTGGNNTFTLGRDMGFGSGVSAVATAGNLTVGVSKRLILDGTGATEIYNGQIDAYNPTGNNNLMIRSWYGIGFPSYDNVVRIGMDTRTGNADFVGTLTAGNMTVASPGIFRKLGGASGTNYIQILGNDTNSPYIEFLTAGVRRAYIGYASATTMDVFSAGGAVLRLGSENVSRMTIQTDGRATHSAGDNSYMTYGPNSTWGASLVVGATPDRGGAGIAQVATTDGNLHLDAGNSKVMYYGYYALVRGFQNRHEFWGPMLAVNGIETAGINNSGGAITSTNQPFCIVGGVGGASIGYGAGTRFGSGGNLFAYTSAGMFNSGTNGWNASLGVFYFPRSGKWTVNWSFYWNNFAAGSRATVEHFNSGGTLLETRYCALNGGGIGADTTQAYSSLFFGDAGSYLVASFQSGSGTLYFGGITHTHVTFYFNS